MNYIRSYSNFKQYRPPKSKWQSFLNLFRRNKSVSYVSQPIGGNRVQKKQFDARYLPNDYTRRNIVALFLLFVITCVWIWNVLYTPFFRINKVTYLGLSLIKRSEIDEFVQNEILNTKWKIPFNNYFLVNAKDAQQKLMSEFSLNSVEIKKIFPVEMRIDLEEKISTIIYDNGNKYYLLDTKGDVIKYLAATELPEKNLSNSSSDNIVATPTSTPVSDDNTSSTLLLDDKKTHIPEYRKLRKDYGQFPILYDMRNLFLNDDDENILTDNYITSLIKWSEELDKQGIGMVKYMTTEHPLSGITVYTSAPWVIYVQPLDDFERQMANLKAVLKTNVPSEYVDLRFGDRVYWK